MDHSRWSKWFEGESKYQDAKFPFRTKHDLWMAEEGFSKGSRWRDDIHMYLHRASILGLENPNGRQALAKAAMVVIAAVESAERVFGPLPEPGHPSGEIREWHVTE